MIKKPYDHVQPLIDANEISEVQWYLFALADEYLQSDDRFSNSVSMKFRSMHVAAFSIGLDVQLPGVLIIRSSQNTTVYAPWADLQMVTTRNG